MKRLIATIILAIIAMTIAGCDFTYHHVAHRHHGPAPRAIIVTGTAPTSATSRRVITPTDTGAGTREYVVLSIAGQSFEPMGGQPAGIQKKNVTNVIGKEQRDCGNPRPLRQKNRLFSQDRDGACRRYLSEQTTNFTD